MVAKPREQHCYEGVGKHWTHLSADVLMRGGSGSAQAPRRGAGRAGERGSRSTDGPSGPGSAVTPSASPSDRGGHSAVRERAQGHTAEKWRRQDAHPASLLREHGLSIAVLSAVPQSQLQWRHEALRAGLLSIPR